MPNRKQRRAARTVRSSVNPMTQAMASHGVEVETDQGRIEVATDETGEPVTWAFSDEAEEAALLAAVPDGEPLEQEVPADSDETVTLGDGAFYNEDEGPAGDDAYGVTAMRLLMEYGVTAKSVVDFARQGKPGRPNMDVYWTMGMLLVIEQLNFLVNQNRAMIGGMDMMLVELRLLNGVVAGEDMHTATGAASEHAEPVA